MTALWVVCKDGSPQEVRYAEALAGASPRVREIRHAGGVTRIATPVNALHLEHEAGERCPDCGLVHDPERLADGWTAHKTQWARVPRLLQAAVIEGNDLGLVVGDDVVIAGCRISMRDPGADRELGVTRARPGTTVEDEGELQRVLNARGLLVRIRLADGTYLRAGATRLAGGPVRPS